MIESRPTILLLCTVLLAACAEEAPPRTVTEFMDEPLLLEAVLLRCTENRAESRYDAECVNAREAVKLIEAKEVAARRAELDEMSERKREALRRTQQAAAEARRRAAEAAKLREEMEYQAQFGLPPAPGRSDSDAMRGNEPGVVVPAPAAAAPGNVGSAPPAGNSAPVSGTQVPAAAADQVDLATIRQEMRRRAEDERSANP